MSLACTVLAGKTLPQIRRVPEFGAFELSIILVPFGPEVSFGHLLFGTLFHQHPWRDFLQGEHAAGRWSSDIEDSNTFTCLHRVVKRPTTTLACK